MKREMLKLGAVELELHETGDGPPLLFLHSGQGFAPDHPFVAMLGKHYRVIAPSHPGFGYSSLPDWLDSIDDVAHIHLELMDRLDLKRVTLVGASIGGWIAAELATKSPERVEKLALIGPVGVKTGDARKLDIPDIFALATEALDRLRFHDPSQAKVDLTKLSEEQMRIIARNNEALALLIWEPYMHNPKLKHRLHRLTMPVLFIRGASDGLVSADYLDRYAKLVPGARIETIPAAGHLPHIEQPEAFVASLTAFLDRGA
ncbi:MAG TPA: alpha/beta fold hydrolase [Stellaceae bacterium]|nr:alpha/beta fold hydrolase [Stellaceae bacterium]